MSNLHRWIFFLVFWGLSHVAVCDAGEKSLDADSIALRTKEVNRLYKEILELPRPSGTKIISLLYGGDYKALEELFADLGRQYKGQVTYEWIWLSAYDSLDANRGDLQPKLDGWVKQHRSPIALCARGYYLANVGYKARGGGFIDKVPREKIDLMRSQLSMAETDLKQAVALDPALLPAWEQLIKISRYLGKRDEARFYLDGAVKGDRRTYFTRYAYMESLVPVWGGSYALMDAFAEESMSYLADNPMIWSLHGDSAAERGYRAYLDGDYESAAKFYTEALRYGERLAWLKMRARCYQKAARLQQAKADLERLSYYLPDDLEVTRQLRELNVP